MRDASSLPPSLRMRNASACDASTKVVSFRLVSAHSGVDLHQVGSAPHPPNAGDYHADGFFSDHDGGANTLFGDGSVRFIANQINRNTWQSLSTRNGGEPINVETQ